MMEMGIINVLIKVLVAEDPKREKEENIVCCFSLKAMDQHERQRWR
jgi:hypothetical protein